MDYKFVLLWTDALLFLLIALTLFFVFKARRREYLLAPWRRVARSRTGMIAAVFLAAYALIGVLDSIHFRPALPSEQADGARHYSAEVLSVLDLIAMPLRTQVEKTYSAPFATHLYAKESITRPDGTEVREYPRLRYGGAHLTDPQSERASDITGLMLRGLGWGIAFSALLLSPVVWRIARQRKMSVGQLFRARGASEIPWLSILLTVAFIITLTAILIQLAPRYHVFGTDKVGQDVFYQSLKSVRTGLMIGTLTTLVMLPFALLLGTLAGYFRGWVDDVIQYLYTTLSSIPGVLLIAASVLILQAYIDRNPEMFQTVAERADLRLLFLCVILGITSWTGLCRLLRAETLKLIEMDYVQAATAFGVGHARTILRHILPNVMHIVLITVVLDFSGLVLAEAVLSYVGVGVDPTMASWGNMINGARLEMAREPMVWWQLAAAFVMMFVLVLSANLFSDAVQKGFDPRVRG